MQSSLGIKGAVCEPRDRSITDETLMTRTCGSPMCWERKTFNDDVFKLFVDCLMKQDRWSTLQYLENGNNTAEQYIIKPS